MRSFPWGTYYEDSFSIRATNPSILGAFPVLAVPSFGCVPPVTLVTLASYNKTALGHTLSKGTFQRRGRVRVHNRKTASWVVSPTPPLLLTTASVFMVETR